MRYRQAREKWGVRGEPAGYKFSEKPHALRLACLPLREKPERSVHVQVGPRRPHQKGVCVSDEARQYRHPEPLSYGNDLGFAVRGPERYPCGADLAFARPIGDTILAHDDPPDGIGRSRTPRGKKLAGNINASEQIRSLQAVKIERQRVAVVDDTDRHVG